MKIVQINAVAEYSSTGRTTSELHRELLKRGHQSWIAATNVSNSTTTIKVGSKVENLLHSLYSRIFGRQGFSSVYSTNRLITRLEEIKPDIVHLRVLHSNFINLPRLINHLASNDIPTVITLHDCWPFTGHCCYFIDSKCDKWKTGCGKCPDLHNWNKSWFFDRTARNLADKSRLWKSIPRLAVVGVSNWVTSFVKDSILADSKIVTRIYNWIDTDLFKPVSSNKRLELGCVNDKIILSVAQFWCSQKGIFDILKLANEMPTFKFILVGGIDKTIELPTNVISVGVAKNANELAEYYSIADVFFNPSSRETFGKVTAEALSCGTPVVAYNATATPELIGDGCGIVVNPGDIDGAKNAIETIIGKTAVQERCRQFAINIFSKPMLIEQTIELYQTIISCKK